jgi:hypothetical protein
MNKKSILIMSVLAAFALGAPVTSFAAKKDKTAAAADSTTAKAVPYHGKVASVDAAAKTFTIKGKTKDRVFTITDKTTIMKDGAAADIAAVVAGEEVTGQATKSGDNWEALKVYVGGKEKGAKGAKKEAAEPAKDGAATPAKPADAAPAAPAPAAPGAPADAKDGASAPAKPADPAAPAEPAK